jgi:flagellin
MSFRIGSNIPSLTAQRFLAKAETRNAHALQALASGSRIVHAGDDAAGFAISEVLRGQGRSLRQAKQNAEGAVSLIQVAEGGLNEQNNILIRLRELGMQAASDTVGDEERDFLNREFEQLTAEFDRIANTTQYGKKKLLTGTGEEFDFHLGVTSEPVDVVSFKMDADTTASNLGIDGMSIEDQDSARDVLSEIDDAIMKVAGVRSSFGAIQSRLQIASGNVDLQYENVEAARSRIADADIAYETSEMVQSGITKDFGIAVLAQANQDAGKALKLLY